MALRGRIGVCCVLATIAGAPLVALSATAADGTERLSCRSPAAEPSRRATASDRRGLHHDLIRLTAKGGLLMARTFRAAIEALTAGRARAGRR